MNILLDALKIILIKLKTMADNIKRIMRRALLMFIEHQEKTKYKHGDIVFVGAIGYCQYVKNSPTDNGWWCGYIYLDDNMDIFDDYDKYNEYLPIGMHIEFTFKEGNIIGWDHGDSHNDKLYSSLATVQQEVKDVYNIIYGAMH